MATLHQASVEVWHFWCTTFIPVISRLMCFQRIIINIYHLINIFDCFRMPVQYVIEEWDFRDLTLKMRPPVFIPRTETEVRSQKMAAQDSSNYQ